MLEQKKNEKQKTLSSDMQQRLLARVASFDERDDIDACAHRCDSVEHETRRVTQLDVVQQRVQ